MPAAISPERLAAAHALLRGEAPTQTRVAAAMGIHATTLAHYKAKLGWVLLDYRRADVTAAHQELQLRLTARFVTGSAAADEGSQAQADDGLAAESGAPSSDASIADMPELSLDEQIAQLGRVLSRQMARILGVADKTGSGLTKAQADTLAVSMRLAEKFGALASERAAEKQKRSDGQLAGILSRVDRRIVELARGLAARMGGGEPRP